MKTQGTNRPSHDASSDNSAWHAIRTFLAEESPSMMHLLARALELDERVMLVGSAMVGPKTFPAASSLTPDLVVMGEHFAGVDCTALTRHLKQLPNPPTIFIVSSDGRAESQSRSLAAGADAVLINAPNLSRQLEDAVRTFFPEAKAERCSLTATGGRDNERSDSLHLNERENKVFQIQQSDARNCVMDTSRHDLATQVVNGSSMHRWLRWTPAVATVFRIRPPRRVIGLPPRLLTAEVTS